jgi:hypothetical protein
LEETAMKLSKLKKEYREMLAYHAIIETAFRISTDDIFVRYGVNSAHGKFNLQVIARQGALQFVINVAVVDTDAETFRYEWDAAAKAHNAAPREERVVLLEASDARKGVAQLIAAMSVKGFRRAEDALCR